MADRYLTILQQYWGYPDFRGIQREIIESLCAGHDTLGLMPTGGGKSITFQVPALALEGVCIVITPLIALMTDQVEALRKRGVRAAAIHSGLVRQEMVEILDTAVFGGYRLLYVSPERLSSELFLVKLRHMKVSFITVDEAHCICQWGYDFRPSYLKIADVRKVKPGVPVLALTATATPQAVDDIQDKLAFHDGKVFSMSFRRDNLSYMVQRCPRRQTYLLKLLRAEPGTCIVYTRNRQNCRALQELLSEEGFSATYYHAGLAQHEKDEHQAKWLDGTYRIIVCTNAFGMGIDKPDVRLVIHMDLPDSIEAYFQEAGRAGRDGLPSRAIILSDGNELRALRARPSQVYPPEEYVRDVYEKICFYLQMAVGDGLNVTRELDLMEFCRSFHLNSILVDSAIALLSNAGYFDFLEGEDNASRLRIRATRSELYGLIGPKQEPLINCLLRNYGGLFVDYCYIDEKLMGYQTGFTFDAIYRMLVGLAKARVVDYIPRKHIPRITFLRRRVDTDLVVLPDSVYKERRECYLQRISAMEAYCTVTDRCRSRMLLEYFGEKSTDCGHCDVCLSQQGGRQLQQRIREKLLALLANGPVAPQDFCLPEEPVCEVAEVIDHMRDDGEIVLSDFRICLADKEQ